MDVSSELRGECFKDFIRVDCPHRMSCRYADLHKKKHCATDLPNVINDAASAAFKRRRLRFKPGVLADYLSRDKRLSMSAKPFMPESR